MSAAIDLAQGAAIAVRRSSLYLMTPEKKYFR
jgi:hypothetical protein